MVEIETLPTLKHLLNQVESFFTWFAIILNHLLSNGSILLATQNQKPTCFNVLAENIGFELQLVFQLRTPNGDP